MTNREPDRVNLVATPECPTDSGAASGVCEKVVSIVHEMVIGDECCNTLVGSVPLHSDSGAYQLLIALDRTHLIQVGALGKREFPAGLYIYTGRASRNLRKRLARHLSRKKKLRWHVDYLLQRARVSSIRVFPGMSALECSVNLHTVRLGAGGYPFRGFGSSDCRCPAHLLWFGHHPPPALEAVASALAMEGNA